MSLGGGCSTPGFLGAASHTSDGLQVSNAIATRFCHCQLGHAATTASRLRT
jgi:hypothetical protein